MNKNITLLRMIIVYAIILAPLLVSAQPDIVGKPAPNWTLKNLEGKAVKFSDFSGKVIILDLWATWCPPCRQEIPAFIELQKQYEKKGLVIIGISLDRTKAPVIQFAKKFGINYPVVMGDAQTA